MCQVPPKLKNRYYQQTQVDLDRCWCVKQLFSPQQAPTISNLVPPQKHHALTYNIYMNNDKSDVPVDLNAHPIVGVSSPQQRQRCRLGIGLARRRGYGKARKQYGGTGELFQSQHNFRHIANFEETSKNAHTHVTSIQVLQVVRPSVTANNRDNTHAIISNNDVRNLNSTMISNNNGNSRMDGGWCKQKQKRSYSASTHTNSSIQHSHEQNTHLNRLDIYNNRGRSDQRVSVNKHNCDNNIDYRHIDSNNMAAYQHMSITQTSEQILHSINNSIDIGNHVNTSTNTAHRLIKNNLRFVNRNSNNNVVNRDNYNGSSNNSKISSMIMNGNIVTSTSTHTNSINNLQNNVSLSPKIYLTSTIHHILDVSNSNYLLPAQYNSPSLRPIDSFSNTHPNNVYSHSNSNSNHNATWKYNSTSTTTLFQTRSPQPQPNQNQHIHLLNTSQIRKLESQCTLRRDKSMSPQYGQVSRECETVVQSKHTGGDRSELDSSQRVQLFKTYQQHQGYDVLQNISANSNSKLNQNPESTKTSFPQKLSRKQAPVQSHKTEVQLTNSHKLKRVNQRTTSPDQTTSHTYTTTNTKEDTQHTYTQPQQPKNLLTPYSPYCIKLKSKNITDFSGVREVETVNSDSFSAEFCDISNTNSNSQVQNSYSNLQNLYNIMLDRNKNKRLIVEQPYVETEGRDVQIFNYRNDNSKLLNEIYSSSLWNNSCDGSINEDMRDTKSLRICNFIKRQRHQHDQDTQISHQQQERPMEHHLSEADTNKSVREYEYKQKQRQAGAQVHIQRQINRLLFN